MAAGNTFGATAFSSYGGFWIAFGFILTPGGFQIQAAYATKSATGAATGALPDDFTNAFGFFLAGWFIFTTILLLCTLRSTVAFFFLFFTLDMAFLFLSIGYLKADAGAPNAKLIKTGGVFGLLAAFLAWYNALAGMADDRYDLPSIQFYGHIPNITNDQCTNIFRSTATPSWFSLSYTSPGLPRAVSRGQKPSVRLFKHTVPRPFTTSMSHFDI
jgi:succinate-acetate transporter protein